MMPHPDNERYPQYFYKVEGICDGCNDLGYFLYRMQLYLEFVKYAKYQLIWYFHRISHVNPTLSVTLFLIQLWTLWTCLSF